MTDQAAYEKVVSAIQEFCHAHEGGEVMISTIAVVAEVHDSAGGYLMDFACDGTGSTSIAYWKTKAMHQEAIDGLRRRENRNDTLDLLRGNLLDSEEDDEGDE